MNTSIHTFTRCRKRESEERIRLREWEFDIPRLQQYVQLHKPEQSSITYLTLALTFSMRLKSIFNITPVSARVWGLYLQLLCLRIPLCSPSLRERVSPKLLIGLEFRSRWSGCWFLAGVAEFWAGFRWQTQLSTRTQRKENKLKSKNKRM